MPTHDDRGGDDHRVRTLVDACLGSDDSIVVLIDRTRAISFMKGFGQSPCQLELLGTQVERFVRQLLADATSANHQQEV